MSNYESKAIINKISATSRASIKNRKTESYFTVEYSEERIIPDIEGVNIAEERKALWDACNEECDNQITVLDKLFKNNS